MNSPQDPDPRLPERERSIGSGTDEQGHPGEKDEGSLRLLIHASEKQSAELQAVLIQPGLRTHACPTMDQLVAALEGGAAAVIVSEDRIAPMAAAEQLGACLRAQPSFLDLSIIVLASEHSSPAFEHALQSVGEWANVVVLDTPLRAQRLVHAARAALRARRRQHATREELERLKRTREELGRLIGELQAQIVARTHELVEANNRLMKEIAGRERAQAALNQGQKLEAIGRLTGGIAHDFNNLLHVVNMNLELVNMYAKEEKVKTVVQRAKTAAKRGARLTGQLLSFARSQSLMPRLTDLNKLLVGMRDLLEISVGSAVQVEMDLCEAPVHVLVDAGQLEMALLNLAVNSKDAMPEGGTVTITTRTQQREAEGDLPSGEYVALSLTDTGTGIPLHVLPKVFDPFFTTKPIGQGTGLGLSQVYGFARQSGGTAHIRSTPGKGTTVKLLFPVADAEGRSSVQQTLQAPAVPGRPSEHVLVVDDDAEVRRVIVECLSVIGYQVTEAANGREGLAAIASSRPDLMVVDYVMPDMTGAEMISRARQEYGEVPFIVATGYADMAAVERLPGEPRILRKPFSMGTLGDAVRQTLDAARQRELAGSAGS